MQKLNIVTLSQVMQAYWVMIDVKKRSHTIYCIDIHIYIYTYE